MGVDIQIRRDTAANWTSANPTLASGEIGLETDTGKWKWGDGSTAWSSLAYYRQYTDAEVTKLSGIETSADVTDATNVASAGAVMADGTGDDLTGDLVFDEKADHSSTPSAGHGYLWTKNTTPSTLIFTDDAGTDTTLGSGGSSDHGALTGLTDDDHTQYLLVAGSRAMTGSLDMGTQAITNVGNVDGRDVSADGTKLDGIESSADVTDATNVAAAGAVMADGTGNDLTGDLVFDEKADHSSTPAAGHGYLWVKNTAPSTLIFTDDTGSDTTLGSGGGGGLNDVVDDTTPQLGGQLDVNGNAIGDGTRELLTFVEDASAVNHLEVENEATGTGPVLRSTGDDTNVDLNIQTKGTGEVNVQATLAVVGNITVSGTVDGRDVATDGTKLDGIETGADVTDAVNVEAAGALMDSEVDADIKTLSLPASTTISTYGATLVDDADAATARGTLGLGALATLATVGTTEIDDEAVTYAKMQHATAGTILGRATGAGTGDVTEIDGSTVLAIAWEDVGANRLLYTSSTVGSVTELVVNTNTLIGRSSSGDITDAAIGAGQIAYNNLAGGGLGPANFDTALKENLQLSKTITVEDPGASEDISFFFTNVAITIEEMRAVLVGSSTPSVTWTIRHGTDRSATGAEVVTSGTTTTSTTTGSDVTSFNDATVVADSFVWLETTAQSGTVDEITITVFYTED